MEDYNQGIKLHFDASTFFLIFFIENFSTKLMTANMDTANPDMLHGCDIKVTKTL